MKNKQLIIQQLLKNYSFKHLVPALATSGVVYGMSSPFVGETGAWLLSTGTAAVVLGALYSKTVQKILYTLPDEDVEVYKLLETGNLSTGKLCDMVKDYCRQKKEQLQDYEDVQNELNRVNQFIENSAVVLFEWTAPAREKAQFVSGSIAYFGYKESDFMEGFVSYEKLVHPEDWERVRRTFEKAREAKMKDYTHMYRILHPNGDVYWVEDWTVLTQSFDKKFSERSILRDVTHEVNLTLQMNESEARFRELFETSGALIFTYDLEGRFTSANRACQEFFGTDMMQLGSKRVQDYLSTLEGPLDLSDLRYMETYLMKPVELKLAAGTNAGKVLEARNTLLFRDDLPREIQTVALDITERKTAQGQVNYLTYHDSLTGLYNRLYFDKLITHLESEPALPLSVIVGDMNDLKTVNVQYGRKMGDQVLIRMTHCIQKAVEGRDALVIRLSGDEFAVLLPDTRQPEAEHLITNILQIASEPVPDLPVFPSIALGAGCWDTENTSLEAVIRQAEDIMLQHKRSLDGTLSE